MKVSVAAVALAWCAYLAVAQTESRGVQPPIQTPVNNEDKSQGCFNGTSSDWTKKTLPPDKNLSRGACTVACRDDEMAVAAMGANECWCGQMYPPENNLSDDSKCNSPCPGYGQEACGTVRRPFFYSVFNTGYDITVGNEEPEEDNDDDSSSTTTSGTSGSQPSATGSSESQAASPSGSQSADDDDDDSGSGGSSTGIIVGVVVGVVVILALVGGGFFFMRRRRNQSIEEEHRRNAAVNSFIAGAKPPSSSGGLSMTDSRMDPGLATRRMSDGSIADNHDYSRKILRVTNA